MSESQCNASIACELPDGSVTFHLTEEQCQYASSPLSLFSLLSLESPALTCAHAAASASGARHSPPLPPPEYQTVAIPLAAPTLSHAEEDAAEGMEHTPVRLSAEAQLGPQQSAEQPTP